MLRSAQFLRLAARAHPRSQARRSLQVREGVEDYGSKRGTGVRAPFPRPSSPPLSLFRVAYCMSCGRGVSISSAKGALRLSATSYPARGPAGPACTRVAGRFHCVVSLCAARPLRNLDLATHSRRRLRANGTESARIYCANLAALLRRTLQRVRSVTEAFHLVLHTSPSSLHRPEILATGRLSMMTITGTLKCRPQSQAKSRVVHIQGGLLLSVTSETAVEAIARGEN